MDFMRPKAAISMKRLLNNDRASHSSKMNRMIYTDGFHIGADSFTELYAFANKINLSLRWLKGKKTYNFVCPKSHKARLKENIKLGFATKVGEGEMYEIIKKMNQNK